MPDNRPPILIFNWKDIEHPQAGGAEVVTHEIAKRLVQDGYPVTLLTARYPYSSEIGEIDGVQIIRTGSSRLGHYFAAFWYYQRHLKNKFEIIVEEVNTLPYLTGLYKGQEKQYLFYHQLAREIWFLEMIQPLSSLGYLLVEPFLTWLQSKLTNGLITVSNSTKQDMMRFGFREEQVSIISEGIENEPLAKLQDSLPKESEFTMLFHSGLRPMKRPLEVLKSFKLVHDKLPNARLWYSGGGDQSELKAYALKHHLENQVTFYGRTTDEQKLNLMQRAHVLCSSSIKEGWGLIVTEANSMGTPAIVYDVDGLRDAGAAGGGEVVDANPKAMAKAALKLQKLVAKKPKQYTAKRQKALDSAKAITFERSYADFRKAIDLT